MGPNTRERNKGVHMSRRIGFKTLRITNDIITYDRNTLLLKRIEQLSLIHQYAGSNQARSIKIIDRNIIEFIKQLCHQTSM